MHRTLAAATSLLLALLAVSTSAARADNTAVPAIAAFDQAFAAANDYHCIIHVHEVKGDRSQNRVYEYWFMKPHFVKTLIQSGDDKGSGGVWNGGDQVSGHQGGLFSGIHLKNFADRPARDVAARDYDSGRLAANRRSHLCESPRHVDASQRRKNRRRSNRPRRPQSCRPAANDGITEQIMYFSQSNHWPVRQILYAGNQNVLDQSISDLKTNVGLTQNDFPF